MSKCKVAYATVKNAGDQFNEGLIDYFNLDAQRSDLYTADLMMLGGGLTSLQPEERLKTRLHQQLKRLQNDMKKPLHVYGSGFIDGTNNAALHRKNLVIHALRGVLTKQKLEKIIGMIIDVPLCDPGLLAREFADNNVGKEHQVGIIAHFREQENPIFQMLLESQTNAIMIDIRKDYHEVLRDIASCEMILSSSLHGLIFSDSLNIPNLHVVAPGKSALVGDGFKFNDYYSSFGLEHNPFELSPGHFPTVNDIIDRYKVRESVIEDKIQVMIDAFPKNLC